MAEASGEVVCGKCGRSFSASENFCPYDGTPLSGELSTPAPSAPVPPTPADKKPEGGDLIGRVLADRYELVAPLGSGGMAQVFVARHRMLDRMLAVKVLKRDLPATSRAAERFRREARAASRIEHENVVFLTDFGVAEDGLMYMVMEYVAGKQLGSLVKKEAGLPWRRAASVGLQLARALEAAHKLGIIHRDLKPENILLVDPGGRDLVKVLDFGIAKLLEPDEEGPAAKLTRAGMVFGTPEYMSPEHAQGMPLDGRSDLYAVGLMVWECLVGRRAIQGRSAPETMALQLSTRPGPPSKQPGVGTLPPALDDLICRLIAKEPDDRPADAAEVAAGFESILELSDKPTPKRAPTRRPRRAPAATLMDEGGIGNLLAGAGLKVPRRRDPLEAREALVLDMVGQIWGDHDRPAEVELALGAFEAAAERLLDVETDLALVEDEATRLRGEHAQWVRRLTEEGAPPQQIAEVRDREERLLADVGARGDVLRARAGRAAGERETRLTTLALLVLYARERVTEMDERYEELERVNREVAVEKGD